MPKVNHAKSLLFFPLESLETRLDKFSNSLDKFLKGLERLETWLDPQSLRIKDRESSFKYRALRDCQPTFERYCTCIHLYCRHWKWVADLFSMEKPPLLLTAQVSKVAIFCYSGQRGKWAKYKIYTVGESSCEMFRKCLYLTCCSILFSSRINSLIPSTHSSMLCNLCSHRNEKTQHCLGENLGKRFPRCSKLEFYCQWFCRPLHTLVLSFSWFMLWSHRWSHRLCMVIVCSNCKYY